MKYFTKSQVEELRKQLATLGVRDTDLPDGSEITGDEVVAIVQDGENRKVKIRDLFEGNIPEDIIKDIKQGKSAYEIWLMQPGNSGKSIAEFLASLKGQTGPAGVTTASAEVDDQTGTPSVTVTKTGSNLHFAFHNLKGSSGSGGGGGGSTSNAVNYVYYVGDEAPEEEQYQPSHGHSTVPHVRYHFSTEEWCWSMPPQEGDVVLYFPGDGTMNAYDTLVFDTDNDDIIAYGLLIDGLVIADLEGGDTPGGGGTSRSITGVQNWFKLCADETVEATPMNVADPSSAAGGSWSLTASSPTITYPYLRCFMQVNYDTPLASGYTYTRSSAFTARYFNSDSSQDMQDLEEAIAALRQELLEDIGNHDTALAALNQALEGLRSSISGSITNQLNELKNRFQHIDGTDVKRIEDNANGLWGVLTSYTDDTNGQKSFSDIVADAKNAKITLQTGSTFFGSAQVGGDVTLNGILGELRARLTEQQVRGLISSATISVDSAALNSVISASEIWWRKNGKFYPYTLYWDGYIQDNPSGTLYTYETYMASAPSGGGPAGDGTDAHPAGPFEPVVIVNQFSAIKQTVDEISASVDTTKYMWNRGNQYKSYDAFETDYANRASTYSAYTYDEYVTNVLGYTKVEVGSALSNMTQTSDEIKLQLGDMGYFWRKARVGGGYDYLNYAVTAGMTRDEYVASMRSAGWELLTYASRMSVVDMFPDSITSLVKNSTLVWIDAAATGAAYCRDYDYWKSDYENVTTVLSYEEWVGQNHSSYELTTVTDSFSRIKQTADSITSAVGDLDDLELRMSSVEQTATDISMAVTKSDYCWVSNADNSVFRGYEYFRDDYNTYKESTQNPLDYEDWVSNTKNFTLSDQFSQISAVKIQGDKIWAGIGDGENVKASIEIIADADVDEDTGSKIILDADNVVINGGLAAGVVKAGAIDSNAVTSDKIMANAITAGKIDTDAVTANKIAAGAVTADKIAANAVTAEKIQAGAITADKINAGAITAEKITTGAITADKFAIGAITSDVLFAASSSIDVMSGKKLLLKDSNEVVVGGAQGSDGVIFWAGNENPDTAAYRAYKNGLLVAENARIRGSVEVTNLSIADGRGNTALSINGDEFEVNTPVDYEGINPWSASGRTNVNFPISDEENLYVEISRFTITRATDSFVVPVLNGTFASEAYGSVSYLEVARVIKHTHEGLVTYTAYPTPYRSEFVGSIDLTSVWNDPDDVWDTITQNANGQYYCETIASISITQIGSVQISGPAVGDEYSVYLVVRGNIDTSTVEQVETSIVPTGSVMLILNSASAQTIHIGSNGFQVDLGDNWYFRSITNGNLGKEMYISCMAENHLCYIKFDSVNGITICNKDGQVRQL